MARFRAPEGWKGRLTVKKEQLSAIRSAYDQEDAFAWLLTGFGKWIEYKRSPFLFHHKLNRLDGRASSVVLVVSPTKSLHTRASRRPF